jgi:hypothetical protein
MNRPPFRSARRRTVEAGALRSGASCRDPGGGRGRGAGRASRSGRAGAPGPARRQRRPGRRPAVADAAAGIAAEIERFCEAVFEPLRTMAHAVAAAIPAGRQPALAECAAVEPRRCRSYGRRNGQVAGSWSPSRADPHLIIDRDRGIWRGWTAARAAGLAPAGVSRPGRGRLPRLHPPGVVGVRGGTGTAGTINGPYRVATCGTDTRSPLTFTVPRSCPGWVRMGRGVRPYVLRPREPNACCCPALRARWPPRQTVVQRGRDGWSCPTFSFPDTREK